MKFTAVVTAHAMDPYKILGNIRYQTRPPDETLCFLSNVTDIPVLERDFQDVTFVPCENKRDWGHDKRAMGVDLATGDALGFFNCDDRYDMEYIATMMEAIEAGADAVYCGWNIPRPVFALGSSTSGNFVVRTEIAREAGYVDRMYEADGTFIERIKGVTDAITFVNRQLYTHNAAL